MSRRDVFHFINGQWVGAPALELKNPATGESVVRYPQCRQEDLQTALKAARNAAPAWSVATPNEKHEIFSKFAEGIKKRSRDLAQFESMSQGKPMELALRLDVEWSRASLVRWQSRQLRNSDTLLNLNYHNASIETVAQPVGVVVVNVSSAFAMVEAVQTIAQALTYGNTCIVLAPVSAAVVLAQVCEIAQSADVPPGVLNVLLGVDTDEFHQAINREPALRFVENAVYKPGFVFVAADADLGDCCEHTLRACYLNQGMTPVSCQNIFVEASVAEKFSEQFQSCVRAIHVDDPLDRRSFMGPLNGELQFHNVTAAVEHLKSQGAHMLTELARPRNLREELNQGHFVNPLLCTQNQPTGNWITPGLPIAQIRPVERLSQAVRLIQKTDVGSATIWSQQASVQRTLSQQIRAQHIWINSWLFAEPMMIGGHGDVLGPVNDDQAQNIFQRHKSIVTK